MRIAEMVRLRPIILLIVLAATPLCAADEKLDTAPIISSLIEVAADADAQVRIAAFEALKIQPGSEQLLELFWRGLEDDDQRIRAISLDRVVELEGPTEKVLKRLILLANARLVTTDDMEMRRLLQSHLISIGAPAIPYLIDALKEDHARYVAIAALGKLPLGEYQATVAAQLTALLKSDNKEVRLAAVQSLQNIMIAEAKRETKAQASAAAQALAATGGIDPRYIAYYIKLLQKYDSNSDGSLTKDEWIVMSKDPAAADTDQDGKITAVELAKWSMRR
jgi:hypothetical protein